MIKDAISMVLCTLYVLTWIGLIIQMINYWNIFLTDYNDKHKKNRKHHFKGGNQ